MQEKLYTPTQVADHLQISRLTVMEYLRDGKLRGTKVGKLWRIAERDLQAFVGGGRASPSPYTTEIPPAPPTLEDAQ